MPVPRSAQSAHMWDLSWLSQEPSQAEKLVCPFSKTDVLISQRNLAEGQEDRKGKKPHLFFLTPWKYIRTLVSFALGTWISRGEGLSLPFPSWELPHLGSEATRINK